MNPTTLELEWISRWNDDSNEDRRFATLDGRGFQLQVGTLQFLAKQLGAKRRVAYAPFKKRNLLLQNQIYLVLDQPIPPGGTVQLTFTNKAPGYLPPKIFNSIKAEVVHLSAILDPLRWSPAIHVNQTGYLPDRAKIALVGYYLGTLGELPLKPGATFTVLNASGQAAYKGTLRLRPDQGFPYPAYHQVLEADFTELRTPGEYRVQVPELGVSYPFRVGEGLAAAVARTYALGLYHQRCGATNMLPFTRFTHGPCHLQPAKIPNTILTSENCNWTLAQENGEPSDDSHQIAPALTNLARSLYPFGKGDSVDTHAGHHDAGDYSKYTINSASFIHQLLVAVDSFPGAADLDNLGIPESGNGRSDLLEETKWEADFLSRMQDDDGGFFFLVYPQARRYENDVLPDKGDPQVVFPKNTAATAAAVAALAQCASSPRFKREFPEAATAYLAGARKGWEFLARAIAKYGKDGAYQRITHYGDEFMHDDELAWAAVELLLATGEDQYRKKTAEWLRPDDPGRRKWGWWRLFDAQGCAVRSYALSPVTGRLTKAQLDPALLQQAQQEVLAAGEDQNRRAQQSAYGTSFPEETKSARSAGWYFSMDAAFDLAVAIQLESFLNSKARSPGQTISPPTPVDPQTVKTDLLDSLISNLNYEQGCNPVNICYLTGLGHKRQFEIVHQFAQNDRRFEPPTGIPLGNIQQGIAWTDVYKDLPGKLSIPSDEEEKGPGSPYPFYDRWADAFNLSQEFVILNQARGLAVASWLMAQTSLANQKWQSQNGIFKGLPEKPRAGQSLTIRMIAEGVNLTNAFFLWETSDGHLSNEIELEWRPVAPGRAWVETEALLPDGRRIFAVRDLAIIK